MSYSTIEFLFLCFVVLSADQLTPGETKTWIFVLLNIKISRKYYIQYYITSEVKFFLPLQEMQ